MEEEMPWLDPDSDAKEEDDSPEDDADEEMPELDPVHPDSDAEEEDNSSEDDADEESDDEDDSSGQEEEEGIPDLQPEDDESPAGELAKALKAFLDHSEEGELRLTSSDVSIVEEDDPRHPSMLQLQRRIDGEEGSFRYISFGPLPVNRDERKEVIKKYLNDPKAPCDPGYLIAATMDGLEEIFEGYTVTISAKVPLPNLLYQTSYRADFEDARWREQTMDDDLLRKSIMIHEGSEEIKFTATYLEAVTDQGTFQICLTEATNSILKWMDL
jgi:hypothetical protein